MVSMPFRSYPRKKPSASLFPEPVPADRPEHFLLAHVDGVAQGGNQAGVLGDIVGLVAEIFAQLRDRSSLFILDDDAVAGGTGIAPRTAVYMRKQMFAGGLRTTMREEITA